MALNDTLWDLLDKVGLGETFDKHGIPPIAFPLIIIAIIALIAFLLLSSGGAPPYECGDGICHTLEGNETNNESYCPEDCTPPEPPAPTSRDIKVYIDGGSTCSSFKVTLQDQSGKTIGSPRDITTRSVTFEDVEEKSVQARVSSEGSTKSAVPSAYINTESKSSIRVHMPDEFCQIGPVMLL